VLRGTRRVEGSAERRFFWIKKRQIAGSGQQETVPPLKRGSLGYGLIEFVLRSRLSKQIASKALLIENDGHGVLSH